MKKRLTKRAPDVWDSAAFSSIFLASAFSCSQSESTPAHTQVTQTVGTPLAKSKIEKNRVREQKNYSTIRQDRMNSQNNSGIGKWLAEHPFVVLLGIIGSCIAVFGFITGWQSIPDLIDNWENPGFIKNPLAEENGLVWQASFYNNKQLENPLAFEGKIRGARNGLRVNWDVGSPNRKVDEDFFSSVFTTTTNFNAGTYCFTIEVDDGAKLFIDGKEVRNTWWGYTPGAVYKTAYQLSNGTHTIQFYYFEEYERASFHISWYENPSIECVTVGHPGVP